jgi:hypothetical protein
MGLLNLRWKSIKIWSELNTMKNYRNKDKLEENNYKRK